MNTRVRLAHFPGDSQAVLEIWREYIGSTKTNLGFQNNDREFSRFPQGYELPHGCVVIAEVHARIGGCVAMREHTAQICEMTRLYVRPFARGLGLGKKVVGALIDQARMAGYAEIRLDVLEEFSHARRIYAELGFAAAPAITHNPVPGTAFLGLGLDWSGHD